MSNIFTRRKYDEQQLQYSDNSNKMFNNHIMNLNSFENKNGCVNPYIPSQGIGQISRPLNTEGFLNFRDKTDIENKLRNQHLELNSNLRTNTDYNGVKKEDIKMCDAFSSAVNEDSRFSNPITLNREMSPQKAELHFSPYLHMNPQNVHTNNDDKMTPVGRMGVSTRYDSKSAGYVNTTRQYKSLLQSREQNDLSKFSSDVSGLLPSRRN